MLLLAQSRLIKKVQDVVFNITISSSSGTFTATATIEGVDPLKTLVEITSVNTGYNNGTGSAYMTQAFSYEGGMWLESSTIVRCTLYAYQVYGTSFTIKVMGRVYELASRPRSLQTIQGNGTTSQSIATVDPTRALLMRGYIASSYNRWEYGPILGANSITWDGRVFSSFGRIQVVEF